MSKLIIETIVYILVCSVLFVGCSAMVKGCNSQIASDMQSHGSND